MANKKKIVQGKFPKMIEYICDLVQRTNSTDPKYIMANLQNVFPEIMDLEKCLNCGESMLASEYSPDILDAVLLLKMAEGVRENLNKGKPFTEANLVHTPSLPTTDAVRHRTTRLSYLNYIQQPASKKNNGYWLITNWGWKALRGEDVPKTVVVFRGQIVSRGVETITLPDMFRTHVDKVQAALQRRATVEGDYRADVSNYNPREWYGAGEQQQGSLL